MTQINRNFPDIKVIRKATQVVLNGGVVLYPADTIYGLGCDPFNPDSLDRIVQLKGRAESKGFLLLIPDLDWIKKLNVNVSSNALQFCKAIWPGPVTVLLQASPGLPKLVSGEKNIVGLRIPDSPFLAAWLHELKHPLVSTSANISGQSPTGLLQDLKEQFEFAVDLFLESGDLDEGMASTVVDLTGSHPTIVREGAGLQEVERLINNHKGTKTRRRKNH